MGADNSVFAVIRTLQHRPRLSNRCVGKTLTIDVTKAASLMGRKSAQSRIERWGKKEFIRRMQEWGKFGGRPKGSVKKTTKGGKQ